MDKSIKENELTDLFKKWNWGAFFLTFIWGVFHGVYFSLLVLVPVIGWIIIPFILGIKGNEWAWKKGDWKSLEEFHKKQELWKKIGILVFIFISTPIFLTMLWIILDVFFAEIK